jgi:hypothetical protein
MHAGTLDRINNSDRECIEFAGGSLNQTRIRRGVFNRGERDCFGMDFVQQSMQSCEPFHRTHCTRFEHVFATIYLSRNIL